jgi:hypothetical protein
MANFFLPVEGGNRAHGPAAASESAISELIIRPAGNGSFGLWGGGPDGKPLVAKVYRGSAVVSDGNAAIVKLSRLTRDPGNHIDVYSATGLKAGDEIYGMLEDGKTRYTAALSIRMATGKAIDIMAEWAQHYRAKTAFARPDLCPLAVPYLALDEKKTGNKMTKLPDNCVGAPLNDVHGMAVHTTAGNDLATPFQTARYRCADTWKGNGASAHFAISGDGTIIQFIPTSFMAFAQHDPGNRQWISVEVDNNGSFPMNVNQLTAAKKLFGWVCSTCHIPRQLATGCLFPKSNQFDQITMTVCEAGGAQVTQDPFWAAMSRGVSCHWWLDPIKSHACPGKGILSQLGSIAKPGLVS